MTFGICEVLWLKHLLEDLGYSAYQPIKLHCDNKASRNIAHNLVQHNRIKHMEVHIFYQGKAGSKDH